MPVIQNNQLRMVKNALATLCLGWTFASAAAAETLSCGKAPYDTPQQVAALVAAAEPVLAQFPVFQGLLGRPDLELCVTDTLIGAQGYFEPENMRLVINGAATADLQLAVLMHELRHVQQFMTGACPAPDLSMRESARAVFAMEADASATTLVVAWAQRESGNSALWNAIAAWPLQKDIAASFAAAMGDSGDVSIAAEAAFTQWYENPIRMEAYYYAACSNYLDVEDRDHLLRSYKQLDPAFFDALCHLPNGVAYRCSDPR